MVVRIVRDWEHPDLMRQSPGGRGWWNDVNFTYTKSVCDYVLVLNRVPRPTTVECSPDRVWCIVQEPPDEYNGHLHRLGSGAALVFTTDHRLRDARYLHTQPALPWHVNKSYDELMACGPEHKTRQLSWITSNACWSRGHRDRLRFLASVKGRLELDLFGRGFSYLEDKWTGLAPYRYSLAIESFSTADYWSEKLADCFLSWTMPIYYGCTNLDQYFPRESFIQIDVHEADAVEKINEAIHSKAYERNLEAIAEARRRVLDRYQLLPFVAEEIARMARGGGGGSPDRPKQTLRLPWRARRGTPWTRSLRTGSTLWWKAFGARAAN